MRLLVVEDEKRLSDGMKRGLEAEGFAVDTADNGIDGLWLAQQQPYAAIVLDIMLPGISGYTICRRLREQDNWTPVLVLTAKDGVHDEVEALETGADDFLTKPYTFAILVARVRALIRRGDAPRPPVLRVGDLSLDPATRRVKRAGQPIDLTAREFAVLEFLFRKPGQVVGK
ncbi:MAG TPA: response regulator transcription factor, partial [Marisediminicola sp.]|nr:response regulator transcription factor [Marisediminicola sp.]